MLKTGSAINSLGQASTASEAFLVDFAKRMGGIASQAGFTIDQVLGLGATPRPTWCNLGSFDNCHR